MSRFPNEDQIQLRDMARRFAQKEVEPRAQAIDQEDRVPPDLIDRCRELGFFGLFTPEAYGGVGTNLTSACMVLEEIAKASPSFAGLLSVEIVLCPGSVNLLGTEDQKQRFLVPSATGEKLLAWSMTEPAGAANIPFHQTRLVADGNGFRLNGLKLFTTQGTAEHFLVMARTHRDGVDGYGVAVVERTQQGVDVAPYESKLGWRGTNTGTVAYTDVFVPQENILGDLLTGNPELAPINQASFIAHSVCALGGAEGLFAKTVEYVKQRELYGAPMSRLQPISYWLAEVHAKVEACRSLLYDAARLHDEGRPDPTLGSLCKAFVCDTMFDCSSKLLQMWGGSGMMDSTGVNRYLRDARTNMIAEAASELHYDIVAGPLLERESRFG
jgi:butyryl-CoA dehydrogenase